MATRSDFLRTAGAAALAASAVSAPRIARAANAPVTVINTGSLDSYVMQNFVQDNGYYGRFGLNGTATNVSDGIKLLASIVNGGSDIAIMTGFEQIFPAIEHGADLKLLAGVTLSPDYAVYCGNPSVKTLKDLEGKSVGVGALGALAHVTMETMLDKAGVDKSKVEFDNIGSSSDAIKAVFTRKIDAAPAQHDYVEDARANNVRVIADGYDLIPKLMIQAAFASTKTIAAKRDVLVRTLAAYGMGFRFINDNAHGPQFEAAYAKAGGTPEHAKVKWEWYRGHHIYATNLQLPLDRLQFVQETNVRLGLQKSIMPLDKIADLSLAHDALKMMH